MRRALVVRIPALAVLLGLWAAGSAVAAPTRTHTLPNGIKVAIFSDRRLPIVHIQALIPAGSRDEGPAEAGAARVTALLLARGTASRDAAGYVQELEALGGTIRADASRDYASISGSFRAVEFDRGLELLADAIVHPIFSEAEFSATRRQAMGTIFQSRRHLDVVAEEHVWGRVMDGHPYALPDGGTLESVAGLTRQKVAAFHRAHYRPQGVMIAVAGDVDADRAIKEVEEVFGSWSGQARPAVEPQRHDHAPGIRLVDVPGAGEAEIRIAVRVPARSNPERYALIVANDLLGAGPDSRLGGGSRMLRMYSSLEFHKDAGLLVVATAARSDSVLSSVQRLRAELRRFVAEPPTEAEVERSRHALARGFSLHLEGLGSQAAQWLTAAALGPGDDEPDHFAERIQAVTADAVRAVAQRYFGSDQAEIVVVGSATDLRTGLETLGQVEVLPFQAPPTAMAVSPAMDTSEPKPEAIQRGRQLMQQSIAAHGGLARLKGVQDMRAEGDVTIYSGEESVSGRQVEMRREPFHLRIENVFMQISTTQSLHGDSAWSRVTAAAGDSTIVEDADGVAGLRHTFSSDLPHLLLIAADPKTRVAYRGREEVAGAMTDVVEVVREGNERWILFLDSNPHRVVAVEENQGSALLPSLRRVFGAFRTVQGLLLPHSEERSVNGQRSLTVTYRTLKVNSGIAASAFRRSSPAADAGHRRR